MTRHGPSDAGPLPAAAALAAVMSAPADHPFVVAQLGQSLDGRIATTAGESRWINGSCALDHVHRLRAAVDAVVVGVSTVVADDPLLNVRRVPGHHPARVVIDPRGRLPAGAKCLAADGVRRLVVRAKTVSDVWSDPATEGIEIILIEPENGQIRPNAIVDALFQRGLKRLLIEGGASTISMFIDAGAVDRLHVLVAPLILGSGKAGLSLAPITRLGEAIRPATAVHILDDGDVLFDCDLRRVQKGG